MSEMVERVAREMFLSQPHMRDRSDADDPPGITEHMSQWRLELWDKLQAGDGVDGDFGKESWLRCARAAIGAMREPTEEMISASSEEGARWGNEEARGFVRSEWRAMIDAALA